MICPIADTVTAKATVVPVSSFATTPNGIAINVAKFISGVIDPPGVTNPMNTNCTYTPNVIAVGISHKIIPINYDATNGLPIQYQPNGVAPPIECW